MPLPETKRELLELQKEVKYYLIQELTGIIDGQLKNQEEYVPICKVPLITSQKEEQTLVATTTKVRSDAESAPRCKIFVLTIMGKKYFKN